MSRRRVGSIAFAVTLVAVSSAAADDARKVAEALDDAIRAYDLTLATVVLAEARDAAASAPTPELAALHVRASLTVAELLRIQWQRVPPADTARRREFGSRIDAVAREGLGVIDGLPESSERERLRADLLATLIRSDYRARRYEKEFKDAVSRALELDEGNARAWVSAAKPYLFASSQHGGDVTEARRLLSHALKLEPTLESARLLRALAHERLGELEAARSDLDAALEANPDCAPAQEVLARLGSG
jgi:tetratricopeptide (TPR) repeat protein